MKLVSEIKLLPNFNHSDLIKQIAKKTKVDENDIINYEIIKQGIDARKKPEIYFVLNVAVEFSKNAYSKIKNLKDIVI